MTLEQQRGGKEGALFRGDPPGTTVCAVSPPPPSYFPLVGQVPQPGVLENGFVLAGSMGDPPYPPPKPLVLCFLLNYPCVQVWGRWGDPGGKDHTHPSVSSQLLCRRLRCPSGGGWGEERYFYPKTLLCS